MVLAAVREDGLKNLMMEKFDHHQTQWETAIKEANRKINLLESGKSSIQTEMDTLRGQAQRYSESTTTFQDKADKTIAKFSAQLSEFHEYLISLEQNDKKMGEYVLDMEKELNDIKMGLSREDPPQVAVSDISKNMGLLADKILAVKSQFSSVTKDLKLKVATLEASVSGLHQQLTCGITHSVKAAAISSTLSSQSSRPTAALGLEFKVSAMVSKQGKKGTEYNSDNLL